MTTKIFYGAIVAVLAGAVIYGAVTGNPLLLMVSLVAVALAALTFYSRARGGGRKR